MRQVVEAAELMGHGMDVAEGGIIECDAGEVLAVGHLVAGVEVIAIGDGFRQVFLDHVDGLQGSGIRQWVRSGGDISFDGVRQRIHARCGREARRHALHEDRVVDSDLRRDAPVEDGHLDLAARIRDDAETRDLGSRAGRRVDGHQRDHLVLGDVDALVVVDLAAVGCNEADGLGAVVRRTAAEGDDAVTALLFEGLDASHDILVRRVRLSTAEDVSRQALVLEDLLDIVGHAGFRQEGICDDHRMRAIEALHELAGFVDSTFTKDIAGWQEIIR